MVMPNLLIAGSQKCGTTWLHHCLSKSSQIFGSTPKELNYFTKDNYLLTKEAYEVFFVEGSSSPWRMESTPHYYQLPNKHRDIARRIYDMLGAELRLLVMLRDPVDRYLSCYTHHMIKGRTPYVAEIDSFTDQFGLLSLGNYASITRYWQSYFPHLNIFLYDDLQFNRQDLLDRVMQCLDVKNDISPADADFNVNTKTRNVKKLRESRAWEILPTLSPDLVDRLGIYYRPQVEDLQQLVGRDLSHWKPMQR